VDPRAGLDNVEKRKFLKLPGLELRPLGRPASRNNDYDLLALDRAFGKCAKSNFIVAFYVRFIPKILKLR
jgi:hypothetical protein